MTEPPSIDTGKPSIARVWDALLGGKDNFEVDREVAAKYCARLPGFDRSARAIRDWLRRTVNWLAETAEIDQFLDLGSGLPTAENVHQVAQSVNPDVVVVYVDNDPVVAAHGRALLEENDNTHFVVGDLGRPEELLRDPVVARLDFTRPLAIIQSATLHFVPDQAAAERIMGAYVDVAPSGSYVAMAHALAPDPGDDAYRGALDMYRNSTAPIAPRTLDQMRALLPGLDLVEPGLVPVAEWWPTGPAVEPLPLTARYCIGGVGRKP